MSLAKQCARARRCEKTGQQMLGKQSELVKQLRGFPWLWAALFTDYRIGAEFRNFTSGRN